MSVKHRQPGVRFRGGPERVSRSRERVGPSSALLPRGFAARAYLRVEPGGQRLAVPERLPDAVFCLDGLPPGTRLPAPACHEPLAAHELAARMIGRVSGGDAFEARLGHLIAVLDQPADGPSHLFAVLSGDRVAQTRELTAP